MNSIVEKNQKFKFFPDVTECPRIDGDPLGVKSYPLIGHRKSLFSETGQIPANAQVVATGNETMDIEVISGAYYIRL